MRVCFTDCAINEICDGSMLELLVTRAEENGTPFDINYKMNALTLKWRVIDRVFQLLVRTGLLTSSLARTLAADEGSTALHFACETGNLRLVRWLLEHGARDSLHIRNATGHTPLSISRLFGPHPAVEAALLAAAEAPDTQSTPVTPCTPGLARVVVCG